MSGRREDSPVDRDPMTAEDDEEKMMGQSGAIDVASIGIAPIVRPEGSPTHPKSSNASSSNGEEVEEKPGVPAFEAISQAVGMGQEASDTHGPKNPIPVEGREGRKFGDGNNRFSGNHPGFQPTGFTMPGSQTGQNPEDGAKQVIPQQGGQGQGFMPQGGGGGGAGNAPGHMNMNPGNVPPPSQGPMFPRGPSTAQMAQDNYPSRSGFDFGSGPTFNQNSGQWVNPNQQFNPQQGFVQPMGPGPGSAVMAGGFQQQQQQPQGGFSQQPNMAQVQNVQQNQPMPGAGRYPMPSSTQKLTSQQLSTYTEDQCQLPGADDNVNINTLIWTDAYGAVTPGYELPIAGDLSLKHVKGDIVGPGMHGDDVKEAGKFATLKEFREKGLTIVPGPIAKYTLLTNQPQVRYYLLGSQSTGEVFQSIAIKDAIISNRASIMEGATTRQMPSGGKEGDVLASRYGASTMEVGIDSEFVDYIIKRITGCEKIFSSKAARVRRGIESSGPYKWLTADIRGQNAATMYLSAESRADNVIVADVLQHAWSNYVRNKNVFERYKVRDVVFDIQKMWVNVWADMKERISRGQYEGDEGMQNLQEEQEAAMAAVLNRVRGMFHDHPGMLNEYGHDYKSNYTNEQLMEAINNIPPHTLLSVIQPGPSLKGTLFLEFRVSYSSGASKKNTDYGSRQTQGDVTSIQVNYQNFVLEDYSELLAPINSSTGLGLNTLGFTNMFALALNHNIIRHPTGVSVKTRDMVFGQNKGGSTNNPGFQNTGRSMFSGGLPPAGPGMSSMQGNPQGQGQFQQNPQQQNFQQQQGFQQGQPQQQYGQPQFQQQQPQFQQQGGFPEQQGGYNAGGYQGQGQQQPQYGGQNTQPPQGQPGPGQPSSNVFAFGR